MKKTKNIFYNIPSPMETASLLKKAGASYHGKILNDVKNVDKYTAASKQALNLGPENFQGQHDQSYWFHLPAGAIAQQLNQIVDLGLIDTVTAAVAGKLRAAKAEEAATAARLASAQADLVRLGAVPQMLESFERLKQLRSAAVRADGRAAAAGRVVATGLELVARIKTLQQAQEALGSVIRLGAAAQAARAKYDAVRVAREAVQEASRRAKQVIPNLEPLTAAADCWQQAERRGRAFQAWRVEYTLAEREVQAALVALEAAQAELEVQTKGICPVCGGRLKLSKA
jgi:hypothetical protein